MEQPIGDKNIDAELTKLLELLEENETIQAYKRIEQRVKDNEKLTELVENIKAAQKDAVQFAHYGKPAAEQEALKRADELTAEFDNHPLVVAYREQLKEANDLLQHITAMIQRGVNDQLEKEGL
ncbi:YlbF family regulator [Enterococcus sp. LJL128]|uniref:YlbF family regulator n=1 Tax=Enterococcus sp. LJL51 TaxID=3416656 RepID=UPI003CF6E301